MTSRTGDLPPGLPAAVEPAPAAAGEQRVGLIVTLPDGSSGQVVRQWPATGGDQQRSVPSAEVRLHNAGATTGIYPTALLSDWRLPTTPGGAR